MKDSFVNSRLVRLTILCVAFFALAALSTARTPATSVHIVNNSSRVIRNLYLSHVDVDDWSGDQMSEGATIGPGQSFDLSNVTCDQQQVRVIAEDLDGCFLSTTVTCGDSATWTITNDTARDCGN